MFHLANGFYFERLESGAVHLMFEDTTRDLKYHTVVTPDAWASAVAAVSARGDTAKAHSEFLFLHNHQEK